VVSIKDYKDQLIEMANFYIEVPKKVECDADKYNAEIGRKASEKLLILLEKVGEGLKKSQLNQLDALLMSLTRGVEQFEKEEIHKRHCHYGQFRYNLREYISKVLASAK